MSKSYLIIDDCTTNRGAIFIEDLHQDKQTAINDALGEWELMCKYDQKRRDAFYVAYAPYENSNVNWDELEIIYTIK